MVIMGKLGFFLNLSSSNRESSEDSKDIGSWLHGDNSELILFVNPDQESFILVVEDTSSRWPVSVETARLKESVSFFEEEVIGNQLLSLSFRQLVQGIVISSKFSSKCLKNT